MRFLRPLYDYTRFHLSARARPIISAVIFLCGLVIFLAARLLPLSPSATALLPWVSGGLILVSTLLMARDFLAWYRTRYDVAFVPDERFIAKAAALTPEAGTTLEKINDSVITFDNEVNRVLNAIRTSIIVRKNWYVLPKTLVPFQGAALSERQPTMNEYKIRLASDVNIGAISSGRPVELQPTDYFRGVASNEIAGNLIERVDQRQPVPERLSVFDLCVANEGRLAPLSQSMLSNHIGVTSLVITGDNYIVLQWQGKTQVDRNKVNLGASGSADWNDIAATTRRRRPPRPAESSLQEVITYAMEREAKEEISAQIGNVFSRTTITGFARYVHRGGKPEFFGITCLNQKFDSLKVRRIEKKWVRFLEKRQLDGNSTRALLNGIINLESEFDPDNTTRASISMLLALRFARDFLVNNPNYQLRP
jgi:hypothetical protein